MVSNVIKVLVLLWTTSCIITRLACQNADEETTTALPLSNCSNIHTIYDSSGVIEGPNCTGCENSTSINEICEVWEIIGGEGKFVLLTLEFNNESLALSDTLIIREGNLNGSQSEIVRFGDTSAKTAETNTIKVASLTSAIIVEYVGTDSSVHGFFQINCSIEEATRQTHLTESWGNISITSGNESYLNYQHTWLLGDEDSDITIDIVIENSTIYDPKESGSGYDFSPIFEPNDLKHTIVYGSHLSIGAGLSVLKQETSYMTSGEVKKPIRLKIARSTAYIYLYATDFSLPDFGFFITYNLTDLPQITTVPPTTPSPFANYTGNYSVGIVDLSKDTFINSATLPKEFQDVIVNYTEMYCNADDSKLDTRVAMGDVLLASNARKGCYVGFQLGFTGICSRNNRPFDVESLSEMLDIYGDQIKKDFGYKIVMEFVYSKVGWIILITATIVCTFIAILVIGIAKRKFHYKRMNNYNDYKPPFVNIMPEPLATVPSPQLNQTSGTNDNIYTTSTEPKRTMFNKKNAANKTPHLRFKGNLQQKQGIDNTGGYEHTEEEATQESDDDIHYELRTQPRKSSSDPHIYDSVDSTYNSIPLEAFHLGTIDATQA